MRCHVIGSFDGVTETFAALGNQAFKEIAEVERYVRIGVLLNDKRGRGVLNESG
jgi:hypothetical protein